MRALARDERALGRIEAEAELLGEGFQYRGILGERSALRVARADPTFELRGRDLARDGRGAEQDGTVGRQPRRIELAAHRQARAFGGGGRERDERAIRQGAGLLGAGHRGRPGDPCRGPRAGVPPPRGFGDHGVAGDERVSLPTEGVGELEAAAIPGDEHLGGAARGHAAESEPGVLGPCRGAARHLG